MATGDSKTAPMDEWIAFPKLLSPKFSTLQFLAQKKTCPVFFSWDLEFCMFLQVFSWDLSVFHGTCPFCSSCCLFVGHFEFNSLPPLAFLEINFDLFSQEGGSKNSIHVQPLRKSADCQGPCFFHILVSSLAFVTTLIT